MWTAWWCAGLVVCVLLGARADSLAHPQVLQQCSTQSEALQVLRAGWDEDLSADGAAADVLFLVERDWWAAAKELLRLVRAQSPGTDLDPARRAITAIRDEASSALMLLRVNTAEDTQLSPAFQWAQSLDTVFLNVKFSSRMDGPTTVLNVVDENVTITRDSLSFSAMGKDKPKRIRLQLTFARDLDPEASSWSFAAVGRVSFTLRKASAELWPHLLRPGSARPKNMSPWLDRQEVLDKEIATEERRAELRRRVEALTSSGGAGAGAGAGAGVSGAATRGVDDDDDDDDEKDAAAIRAETAARRARATAAAAQAAELRPRDATPQPRRTPPPSVPSKKAAGGGVRPRAAREPPVDVRSWNESRLLSWLHDEGFGKWAAQCAKHQLDGAALAETSEDELRAELGMKIVGERKRLRLAVCRAHPACTVTPNALDGWTVEDVASWLVEHGLGAYAKEFRRQQIDGPALLELSEEELKAELRMKSLRERKVLRVRLCEASSECDIMPTEVAEWSEPQVASWLDRFGYGAHRRAFARKGIDGLALLELTEPDLRDEFKVAALGLRKRFGRSLCAADKRVCPAIEGQPDQYTDKKQAQGA